ncbi:hypothetical protein P4H67_32520 [Paenibacillus lautus]|uniref:hypothetical protein n=1 Tax=Paenibacillus lautus TaxID=1401 RepID=UPI002DBBEA25|nr:hypothetical protein [Paenibacillus lautus]MEC0311497.1 hypothetical protein [Paenibacillus lautus]
MTKVKDERFWWHKPLRVIQPNMQVRDTACIDPPRLAAQLKEMGANAMVFNTGGIYAWYDTQIPYHTVNGYLPEGRDLLGELITACHLEELRFIARFDFSKADDSVYLRRPEWFVRKESGRPEIIGAERPGPWPLLMSTCINGGYRNADVAAPVLREVLSRYPIDGVFFNNPGYVFCRCERCRRKYAKRYGKLLPDSPQELEPDFAAGCFDDNMKAMYDLIKRERAEVPMILYYNLHRDDLSKRVQITDMLCTEPQDVLSLGHAQIPEFWKPALSIKVGRSVPGRPAPFGIVHSCPGMDWRHTGLPVAEYRFWLAQIPANGGQIWHSVTGIPDTIEDQRILKTVAELNHHAAKLDAYMDGAVSAAETALLWNERGEAQSWAETLINRQIPFDVLLPQSRKDWELGRYRVVLVPEGTEFTPSLIQDLRSYVHGGGQLLTEGALPSAAADAGVKPLHDLLGISDEAFKSEYLIASYLRFQELPCEINPLQQGMDKTALIAHRGYVTYAQPRNYAVRVLATLVPPFSPPESVGAPPERASLPVSRTDLPLALEQSWGAGRAMYFTFSLGALLREFKLPEHEMLLANAIYHLLDGKPQLSVTPYPGLQATLFRSGSDLLLHFVNGAGRRPLAAALPLHDIEVRLRPGTRWPTGSGFKLETLIGGGYIEGSAANDVLNFTLPRLEVWECIRIPLNPTVTAVGEG